MVSPKKTVNGLMQWLSRTLGVVLPTLAFFKGFPSMQALWRGAISGFPDPNKPFPWRVPVKGSWSELFPDAPNLDVTVTIVVDENDESQSDQEGW